LDVGFNRRIVTVLLPQRQTPAFVQILAQNQPLLSEPMSWSDALKGQLYHFRNVFSSMARPSDGHEAPEELPRWPGDGTMSRQPTSKRGHDI